MDPPNLGALHLSDSDTDGDALFDTPAARKTNKTKDVESDAEGATGSRPRAKESHYTAEEAREEALRRELESIRNVNKVIEGVIESLQKAKDNMAVRNKFGRDTMLQLTCFQDRSPHCAKCIHPTTDMDPHPVANRTQPAPYSEPSMARRVARSS